MTDLATIELRAYRTDELRRDGYPTAWPDINAAVVEQAGARCVRCQHPYRKGQHGRGEWSPCDPLCRHAGPVRLIGSHDGELTFYEEVIDDGYGGGALAGEVALPPGPEIQARWRILTVHHLDGDKTNCRWWNLVALCQRCHLTIQGRVRMAQVFPFEHSDWFKPYAAGFYAWFYLNEELTREDVEPRLDDLLSLERVL